MTRGTVRRETTPDRFQRLYGQFMRHFGMAVGFAWAFSLFAATQAPWTRNLRGLIDPAGRPESTLAFLFGLPLLLTAGWVSAHVCQDVMRRTTLFRNLALEFAVAFAAVFFVFALSIHRAVAAILVGL